MKVRLVVTYDLVRSFQVMLHLEKKLVGGVYTIANYSWKWIILVDSYLQGYPLEPIITLTSGRTVLL